MDQRLLQATEWSSGLILDIWPYGETLLLKRPDQTRAADVLRVNRDSAYGAGRIADSFREGKS